MAILKFIKICTSHMYIAPAFICGRSDHVMHVFKKRKEKNNNNISLPCCNKQACKLAKLPEFSKISIVL